MANERVTLENLTRFKEDSDKIYASKGHTHSEYLTTDDISSYISTVYKYKGSVANYAALPSSGQTVGDVYNVEAADTTNGIKAGDNVAWTGSAWDVLAGTVDLSAYATTASLANATVSKATSADSATKATQDGDGNVISTTYAKTADLATVATSGSYNDLSDTPTIPSEVTEATVSGWGFTKNTGTLTASSTLDATKLSGTIPASCYTDTNTTYSAGTGLSLSGTTFSNAGVTSFNGSTGAVTATIPVITSGTTDLTAGTSSLASGTIYLVYE